MAPLPVDGRGRAAALAPMEVVELLPLIWATLARSQSVCPWEPYGRGSSGHIRGGMASNPPTMRTRRNHGRRLFAKNSGRRWTLPAVPMGAGGRPHTAGKLVTSSFSWAGSGVLDGCEVGADRRRNRFAQKNLSAQNSLFTDIRYGAPPTPLPGPYHAAPELRSQVTRFPAAEGSSWCWSRNRSGLSETTMHPKNPDRKKTSQPTARTPRTLNGGSERGLSPRHAHARAGRAHGNTCSGPQTRESGACTPSSVR